MQTSRDHDGEDVARGAGASPDPWKPVCHGPRSAPNLVHVVETCRRPGDVLAVAGRSAPSAPGVYFMLSDSLEILYVGKAGNLRQRLKQHARAADLGVTPRDMLRQ